MSIEEQQYIKGFNHGYLLTKHLPDLVLKLVKGITGKTGDYFAGFFSGKEECEMEHTKDQLAEFDAIRNQQIDKEREIE
ncbi:MAG: hypothetical protein JWQ38_1422 [Flavipsychrobacter sp.]|nr:hypothetical protein [Flavipsychrobacter sp.]